MIMIFCSNDETHQAWTKYGNGEGRSREMTRKVEEIITQNGIYEEEEKRVKRGRGEKKGYKLGVWKKRRRRYRARKKQNN